MSHSREEVLALLQEAQVAVVATAAGEKLRTRMMHFAADGDFSIYLATMKGDPKTLQMAQHQNMSLLVFFPAENFAESQEIEFTGVPRFVPPEERARALELVAARSPVVQHLVSTGNAGMLDCIRVEPELVKLRVFKEIVQGQPPTVLDFERGQAPVSEWRMLGHKLRNVYRELRPAFLTAATVPILLGSAVAFSLSGGRFHWGYFVLTLLAGLLIQAGANSINDYYDHKSGNDAANREFVRPFSGGSRLIQLGLLSPLEVLSIAMLCFTASAGIGLYLAWARGPVILLLGLVGGLSGLFYTGHPFYWAKRGLGELLIGLNFGPLMALGAYYVQTQQLGWAPVIAGIPVGLLISGVLFINEFPDYNADKAVGKRTLVVRLGLSRAVAFFAVIVGGAYAAIIAGVATGYLPLGSLLALAALPTAVLAVRCARVYHSRSFDLAPANALTITGHLAVGLVLTWVFAFQAAGSSGIAGMALLALVFAGFVGYMFWYVEHQKRVFHGVKQVVQ